MNGHGWFRRLSCAVLVSVLLAPSGLPGASVSLAAHSAPMRGVSAVAAQSSGQDNNIEWDGVRHDSRDPLYRTPGGAVPAGTPVTLRLRTFHNDVTAVQLRVYDLNANGQVFYAMQPA